MASSLHCRMSGAAAPRPLSCRIPRREAAFDRAANLRRWVAVCLAGGLLLAAGAVECRQRSEDSVRAAWTRFAARHVTEGRVVDSGQGGITHSEGQGAALLAAATAGDRPAFDRLWSWTRQHLQVRQDGLLAWRFAPGVGITDPNNATDGDVFVAWALARAARRWQDDSLGKEAARLAAAIRTRLVVNTEFGPVLLPGMDGFRKEEGPVINLSYWLFPAFAELDAVDPDPLWPALSRSGLVLLEAARFGRWQLPADWLQIRGRTVVLAPGFPPRFGNDAIRIPLYLRWARLASPALRRSQDFWGHFRGAGFLPAWTSLADDSIDSHDASVGHRQLVAWLGGPPSPTEGMEAAFSQGYYSSFLALMKTLAESAPP